MKSLRTRIGGAILLVLAACGGGGTGGGEGGDGDSSDGTGPELRLLAGALGGPGNRNGAGGDSRFNNPSGVATDGTSLFVADTSNSTIRRIVIATGAVTPLAGTAGSYGSADGIGAAARFYVPSSVATDGTNVFVADTFNQTIRRIVISSGSVTTLAGLAGTGGSADGFGTAARFYFPKAVATDGTNVFVADSSNYTIRQIVISSGAVTTLAGLAGAAGTADGVGADARFYGPRGVATDGTYVFVADTFNQTIRQIAISSRVVTTVAGTAGLTGSADGIGASARFYSPLGVATDGTSVFVADTNNHVIRRIVISSGAVTTFAGTAGSSGRADGTGLAARFNYPKGIAAYGEKVFVADSINHTIRRIVIATGAVTTLAGTAGSYGAADGIGSAARFDSPWGVATDGPNLYVADTYNYTIRRIVIATGAVTTLAGTAGEYGSADGIGAAARFYEPMGVATDGANLYVADLYNHTIRQIVISSRMVTTMAGAAGLTGSADGIGSAARFDSPWGVATDGTSVFVADTGNGTIRQIAISSGVVTTLAGTPGLGGTADGVGAAARFLVPVGVATDGTNVFVADTKIQTIRQIVISSGAVTTLAGLAGAAGTADGVGSAARFASPSAVATDGTNVFVADAGNYTVRKIVLSTGEVTTPIGVAGRSGVDLGPLPGGLNVTYGIAVGSGRLFLAVAGENSILMAPAP